MKIPFHKPFIPEDVNDVFRDTIVNGWLTTGPQVKNFEKDLQEFTKIENIVAVSSCTAALHLALAAKNFNKGTKFIVPTYTFVASVEVGEYLGMQPILVDSMPENFNLDLDQVEFLLKKDDEIKVIIPVHFAGELVDREHLNYLAKKYNIFILEDAAHSLESISSSKSHSRDSAVAFSFYANKNITTGGEGGAIATFNKKLSDKIRQLSLHGMSKDGWRRFKFGSKWKYDVSDLGYKYNMTDISASFGINQLDKINEWKAKRLKIVSEYSNGLKNCDGLICPRVDIDNHAWHLYIIQTLPNKWNISRDELIFKLNELGVGTSVHYIPVHMHSYYQKKYGFKDSDFPNAKLYSQTVISLPLYPILKIKEVKYIIDALKILWEKYKK